VHWIALLPPDSHALPWRWHALRFTPHVAQASMAHAAVAGGRGHSQGRAQQPALALLLEASLSERLFGGRRALLRRLLRGDGQLQPPSTRVPWQQASSAQVALALLRCQCWGLARPTQVPEGLPLITLEAAQRHAATLERMGCRTWGELRALPRDGVARRFGAGLLEAIDQAWGLAPEPQAWIGLPERFDEREDLPFIAQGLEGLAGTLSQLLALLRRWLVARQLGALRLELRWAYDQKRLHGLALPAQGRLELGSARPTQDVAYLRRLLDEHLLRTGLAAPVRSLRLRSLVTAPWVADGRSLLPQDHRPGEPLHQFIERVAARLGAQCVRRLRPLADHRPERQQGWEEAAGSGVLQGDGFDPEALFPPWLLPQPLPLAVHNNVPQHGGPLWRMARLQRVETAWWEPIGPGADTAVPTLRDYFIAHSPTHGWVWIYRERFQWFLQGCYA
jgi:protein ImuB